MILPEPKFMSMREAAIEYHTSIERLRWYAEKKLLPVYVKSITSSKYARVVAPKWKGDALSAFHAIYIDEAKDLDPIHLDESGRIEVSHMMSNGNSYDQIMINPIELINLADKLSKNNSTADKEIKQILCSHADELLNDLKKQDLDDKTIAGELKKAFPGLSDFRIGKMLPAKLPTPGKKLSDSAHRKRGNRLVAAGRTLPSLSKSTSTDPL